VLPTCYAKTKMDPGMTQPHNGHLGSSRSLSHTPVSLHIITRTSIMKPIIAVPAIAVLVYRAHSRKSLTPVGIVTAFVTAVIHAVHPWSVFLALLAVFFLAGSSVTKVRYMYSLNWTVTNRV
jgi:uncharacterized membrane protein